MVACAITCYLSGRHHFRDRFNMRIAIALAAMLAGATASFADDDIAAGSRAICYASGVRIGEATMSEIKTDREIQEWMTQSDDEEAMDVIHSNVATEPRTLPKIN